MNVLFGISVFYICYGIAGVLGIQRIPKKYKGYSWTKKYKRSSGVAWLMLGIPWLIIIEIAKYTGTKFFLAGIVISALPALAYSFWIQWKYNKKISE